MRAKLVAAFVAASLAGPARAADHNATVQGGTVSGAAAVNVAAGANNQQANAALVSTGGLTGTLATISQSLDDAAGSTGSLNASLAPGSFAGSAGWLAVNGAAGSGNQQANLAVIALGTTGVALSDIALSQARAPHEPTGGPDTGADLHERSAAIGDGSFANSSGVIQVSLIGGDRNSSANILALSSSVGANH